MADEHIRAPGDQIRPEPPRPAARPEGQRPSAGADGRPVPQHPHHVRDAAQSFLGFVRWCAGLLIVLCVGWGFVFLVGSLARAWNVGISFNLACFIAWLVSFGFFYLLEQDLWLSRFMGLRVGRDSSPLLEAILLWVLGVIYLLFRSSPTPEEAEAEAAPADRASRPAAQGEPPRRQAPTAHKDSLREVIETVVFVVVLVLLLKTFIAEAFVIPTGSMATTLLGYNKEVTCPECKYTFPVNCSKEGDPQESEPQRVTGCTCPNCRLHITFPRAAGGPARPDD